MKLLKILKCFASLILQLVLDILGFGIYLVFAGMFFGGIYVILVEFRGSIYELLGYVFITGLCGVLAYPLIEEFQRLPSDLHEKVKALQDALHNK